MRKRYMTLIWKIEIHGHTLQQEEFRAIMSDKRLDQRPIKIDVRNLTKEFWELLVLDDISCNVAEGECRRPENQFDARYAAAISTETWLCLMFY